jgi:hypothetical protein
VSTAGDVDLIVGVDTHRDTHTAAVCDGRGRVLSQLKVPAAPAGYRRGSRHAFRNGPLGLIGKAQGQAGHSVSPS